MKKILSVIIALTLISVSGTAYSNTIHLATVDWPPIYGKDLPENGYFAALTREAFKRAGYELKIDFVPWKRAVEMASRGKYDGILGAYYSDERTRSFYYTDALVRNEEVFVQNKGKGIAYSELNDLKAYKIGGLRGSAQIKELQEKGFKVEETTDDLMSLKKLNAGRIDLMIVGKSFLYYSLQNQEDMKKYKGTFEILDPPYKSYELFCPITKKRADGENVVKKFNNALQEMKDDGTYDMILERFGQK